MAYDNNLLRWEILRLSRLGLSPDAIAERLACPYYIVRYVIDESTRRERHVPPTQ